VKTTGICPKCQGRKLFHVTAVRHTYCDAQGSLRDFNVTSAEVPTGKKGVFGGTSTEIESAGPYETLVCAGCGYAEWYVPRYALEALERLSKATGAVRLIDGSNPSDTPFR
jgi:hypothetical protein